METQRKGIRFGLAAKTSLFVGVLVRISPTFFRYVSYTVLNSCFIDRELSVLGRGAPMLGSGSGSG